MGQKAVVYARVSTTRQADHDLSIPDQLAHAERYCAERDIEIVERYVDPGASARDDNRPEFQRMIAAVKSGQVQGDLILVHSFSRFFREALGSAYYSRILAKHGLKVISMTQETGDGPQGDLMRQVLSSFDEYQSKETAKHVTRSMLENARRGYWNGSLPPFGYKTIIAERVGNKDKKKLASEPKEAELVKLIFRLYLHGDGKSGPMGVKNVVSHLNERGFTHRKGRRFRIQTVHGILTRTAYIGTHYFNRRDGRTQRPKPQEEWIPIEVPRTVEDDIFYAVQDQLKARHSSITHPRITNSQILLTGIANCDHCGAPMRIQTGKSGKYRYYVCSKKTDSGGAACTGVRVSMPKLDEVVIDALCDRIIQPERLKEIVGALVARNCGRRDALQKELKELRNQRRDIGKQIQNLVDAIEAGGATQMRALNARLSKRQNQDDELIRIIAFKERELNQPVSEVSSRRVEIVSKALRAALKGDNNPQLRRAYIRHFLTEVSVSEDTIRVTGPKAVLAQQLTTEEPLSPSMVPSTVQEWRAGRDSNPRPPDS